MREDCKERWIKLSECNKKTIAQIDAQFHCFMRHVGSDSLNGKQWSYQEENQLDEQTEILQIVRQELDNIVNPVTFPLLFFYLDQDCTLLDVIGNEQEKIKLGASHIDVGFQFTTANVGIHSITLCALLDQPVVIKTQEHHLPLFHPYISLCKPIIVYKKRIGYLAMSYGAQDENCFFASMMIDMIGSQISKKLEARIRFQSYQLTRREEEVAFQWMKSESIPNIAAQMGITEGTVKNYIKQIYMKTGIRNKGEFILKCMGNGIEGLPLHHYSGSAQN